MSEVAISVANLEIYLKQLGLDPLAIRLIVQRWFALMLHLPRWLSDQNDFCNEFLYPENHQQLRRALAEFKRSVLTEGLQYRFPTAAGVQTWQDTYLISLAIDLDLEDEAEQELIALCYSRGWFDQLGLKGQRRLRPPLADTSPLIREIVQTFEFEGQRATAFMERGVCRDPQMAQRVARELTKRADATLANRADRVINAFIEAGFVGLLRLSAYPCFDELLYLERQAGDIEALVRDAQQLIAKLRADIIALYHGLTSLYPDLWPYHLLFEGTYTENRTEFKRRLVPIRQPAIMAIAAYRACSYSQAEHLLDNFASAGLAGLIDCHILDSSDKTVITTAQNFSSRRLLRWVDRMTNSLEEETRTTIRTMTAHLLDAIHEVNFPIAVTPLIKDLPSSRRRKRWGAKLHSGVPSISRRRHERSKQRAAFIQRSRILWHKPEHQQQRDLKIPPLEAALIKAFARRARLDERTATACVRDFITYGVLGMLPKTLRYERLAPEFFSMLQFYRFACVDGTLDWPRVKGVLERRAKEIQLIPPVTHLVSSIFNSLPKPSYWHTGKGASTDGVSHQGSLIIEGRPRIHAVWLLVPLKLYSDVIKQDLNGLLVFDRNSQLSVGCWVDTRPLHLREVALALYQAIWQPGVKDWPLHGRPETCLIPKSCLDGSIDELQRAAEFLTTKIEVIDTMSLVGLPQIQRLIKDFKAQGREDLLKAMQQESLSQWRVLHWMLSWLRCYSFQNHLPPDDAQLPLSVRERSLAMPGYDTPAAGWLLPRVGTGVVETEGILLNGCWYSNPYTSLAPGTKVIYRTYPYFYPERDLGVFVEFEADGLPQLRYLVRKG